MRTEIEVIQENSNLSEEIISEEYGIDINNNGDCNVTLLNVTINIGD